MTHTEYINKTSSVTKPQERAEYSLRTAKWHTKINCVFSPRQLIAKSLLKKRAIWVVTSCTLVKFYACLTLNTKHQRRVGTSTNYVPVDTVSESIGIESSRDITVQGTLHTSEAAVCRAHSCCGHRDNPWLPAVKASYRATLEEGNVSVQTKINVNYI